jgi:hypothetical protein
MKFKNCKGMKDIIFRIELLYQFSSSLEACQRDLDNERSMKAEQLVSTASTSDDIRLSRLLLL